MHSVRIRRTRYDAHHRLAGWQVTALNYDAPYTGIQEVDKPFLSRLFSPVQKQHVYQTKRSVPQRFASSPPLCGAPVCRRDVSDLRPSAYRVHPPLSGAILRASTEHRKRRTSRSPSNTTRTTKFTTNSKTPFNSNLISTSTLLMKETSTHFHSNPFIIYDHA